MEFTGGGRLEVRLTPSDVGKRVSVRQLTESGSGPEKFTDTVGVLTSWDGGVLLITRRSGERVRVPESALVGGKVVPAAPARRRGPAASFQELTRVAARSWQPVEDEPLGEWRLRAASGFTRRANSVLPLGEPGMPLDAALARVRHWYGERGLPPYIQAATGAEGTQEVLCAELERRGWLREVTAEVRVGALAPLADREVAEPGTGPFSVRLHRTVDAAWLRRYQRSPGEPGAEVRQVLGAGPSVWFATVPGPEGPGEPGGPEDAGPGDAGAAGAGAPAAIGRCVVDGRWAGFMAVEVDPAYRRRGLATAVMAALARRALEEGASAAWLQVEVENTAARALYDPLGFAIHHHYHHFRSP
ncbi:GNAT family N-acetyltransferase [Streptomyces sp. NPDC093085]|uniref:GNAT family N-acetyltransferase n=1 Tax=Streptomyces sp. NPDC093085 TaxID=3155068 RepID=UPI003432D968